jgi:hypothetical protein
MGNMIVYGIKIGIAIAVGVTFATAIATLLNLLTQFVFGGVITEAFNIISMCLPFDASKVFGAIATVIVGILSFLVSKKVYELTMNMQRSA